jgi:hypothetical protein
MENTPVQKKPFPVWPGVILLLIALLAGGGYFAFQKYLAGDKWKPLLQAQLKEMIAKSTDSLYHIEYSDFDLNITSGDAILTDFKLVPDTAV